MPDDGSRYEAIDGILYVTAAPRWRHQIVSKRLLVRLSELLADPGHGEVVAAPGVEFPATGEGVQPDILRDRGAKRRLYERHGVREYWVVDPEENQVDVYRFGSGTGAGPTLHAGPERFDRLLPVRLGVTQVGVTDLSGIFAPVLGDAPR